MKPSPAQVAALALIEGGHPVTPRQEAEKRQTPGNFPMEVAAYQWSRDGEALLAHRTIRIPGIVDPRLAFRTELFRIQRDGRVDRL